VSNYESVDIRDAQIIRLCGERADAERRIAAALACHTETTARDFYKSFPPELLPMSLDFAICACGFPWDTTADRCTSPTVTVLVGDSG
jgi:hypothetical protein